MYTFSVVAGLLKNVILEIKPRPTTGVPYNLLTPDYEDTTTELPRYKYHKTLPDPPAFIYGDPGDIH